MNTKNESLVFEENYLKYMKSGKGLGNIIGKASMSFRYMFLLISIGITVFLILFGMSDLLLPPIFILPFAAISFVVLVLPSLYMIIRTLYIQKRFSMLKKMVKRKRNEKPQKAIMVVNNKSVYTFLVYENSIPVDKMMLEADTFKKWHKKYKKAKFNDFKSFVKENNFRGEVRVTDFSDNKIKVFDKKSDLPLIQVSFKSKEIETSIVNGISSENNFILYPPSVWTEVKKTKGRTN